MFRIVLYLRATPHQSDLLLMAAVVSCLQQQALQHVRVSTTGRDRLDCPVGCLKG